MRRVVCCIPYDSGKSGISVYVREVVRTLLAQGHELTLLVEPSGGPPSSAAETDAQERVPPRGLATVTVSAVGKISGKFYEGGTNWTLTAASYTGYDTDASNCTATVTAKYSWKVKSGKKTVTKSVSRTFTLTVAPGEFGGVATLTETGESQSSATEITARQNLWGSTYKAVGKKLFYTSKKKPYMTFDRTVEVDGKECALTLKVTPTGAVTATLSYDTGKTKKDPKTKKTEKVIYKATCQTVVIPLTAADADPFVGQAFLYFAPSAANGFAGYVGVVPLPF
jgi:hypothetical protein